MSIRRAALERVSAQRSTHVGLWLDKYLRMQPGSGNGSEGARGDHILEATKRDIPDGYGDAFQRWRDSFDKDAVRRFDVKVDGRLVIGLGSKNVLEMGLRLDHTWGMPILPGSALKGLASRVAHNHLDGDGWNRPTAPDQKDAGSFHGYLFGTIERAGAVTFHDAWWIPDPKQKMVPVELDVMTVHHPNYYQKPERPEPPSDFDNPIPNAFATVFGSFCVVLEASPGVSRGWLDIAHDLLIRGFELEGLGAKTNAGYGRLSEVGVQPPPRVSATPQGSAVPLAASVDELKADLGNLKPQTAGNLVPDLLTKYRTQGDDALSRFADAAIKALGERWLRDRKDKAYVKDLFAAAKKPLP